MMIEFESVYFVFGIWKVVCFMFGIWKCVFGIWSVSCDVGWQRGWGEGLTRH